MPSSSVTVLTLANPPVNTISRAVRAALIDGFKRPQVTAQDIAYAGRTFFAGADIKEFGKPAAQPFLIAAIHGI